MIETYVYWTEIGGKQWAERYYSIFDSTPIMSGVILPQMKQTGIKKKWRKGLALRNRYVYGMYTKKTQR